MQSWFCTRSDLLRLFAIARVANPKNGLNLVQTRCCSRTLAETFSEEKKRKNEKHHNLYHLIFVLI
jgi:hypothetical protein